jgi:hypothetical protein
MVFMPIPMEDNVRAVSLPLLALLSGSSPRHPDPAPPVFVVHFMKSFAKICLQCGKPVGFKGG